MKLSPPTNIVFIISLVVAVLGLLAGLGVLAFLPISGFWLMAIAYGVMLAGVMLKGV